MAVASLTPSKSLCRSHSPSSSRSSPPSISSSIGFSDGRRGSWARIVSGGLDLAGRSHAPAEMLVGSTSKEASSGIDGWRRRRRRRGGVGAIMCSADGIGSGLEIEQQQGLAAVVIPERAKVLALVALVMCLCNADRVVMSVAVVPLASQYGWSSSFMGIVQSSFLWGYPISNIAGGALADRYGSKRVMAWGVVFWSIATFLTPWAARHSTAMLLAIRALFGLAEGVAIPSMSTHLFRWFPCNERASAVGIAMAGFHLGNVMSLLVSPIILSSVGINGTFAFFASLGFVWLSAWTGRIPNDPRDSPDISHSELQLIRAGKIDSKTESGQLPPLRHLFSKLPALAVVLANVANNWGYFVLLSWMPVYFKTVYNVNLKQAAWFSAVPFGVMALSGYLAGASSDLMIKSGSSIIHVRKLMQTIGFIGPAVSLLLLRYAQTPTSAAVLMTMALSFSAFSQAGYFLNIQDIAPKHAGFLLGITNSVGTLAAIISTVGAGLFVQWMGSFQAFLTLTAAIYFVIAIFYNLHATAEQVFF
ncbi:unnamed protein product [Musa banksii]